MDFWPCNESLPLVANEVIQSSGSAFTLAVNTIIAAHCALTTPLQWPPDKRSEILAGK